VVVKLKDGIRKQKKRGRSFHANTIDLLEDRVRDKNCVILKEFKYKFRGYHEADLLVLNNNYAYAFEVKTTDRPSASAKAYIQLDADKIYIQKQYKINRVFSFYVYQNRNESKFDYTIERVRL